MQIKQVGMTRNHFEAGDANRIHMIVMHSTAGTAPGDYNWLRQGGSDANPVSIHYYIDKAGTISQMVADHLVAWHAGRSSWTIDGRAINGCNSISIGIELENRNTGRDPYPQAQYDAALALVRALVAQYHIPRRQLVRHLDIAPRRKTDPAGFPWERFVAEVYSPTPDPTPGPAPDPLAPAQQLRKFLVDLAYRAVGAAHPSGWPLLKESVSKDTGMPIISITATTSGDGESQDDESRTVTLPGHPPLVLEAYGRDLFFAPPDQLEQPQRLSQLAAGPLRDALLQTLFQSADPANGFKSDWAFHQLYLSHMTEIGVPTSPNHRLPGQTSDGQQYTCQHFALDTLCSPVGKWSTVIRLSDLCRDMYGADPHQPWEKELRNLLLNDLYTTRTNRAFDPNALFCRYALLHGLGAPQGRAEFQILEGKRLVAMPFALDVLYCRIPGDGDWRNVVVGELPGILGEETDGLARLSTLLAQGDVDAEAPAVLALEHIEDVLPQRVYTGGLLGIEQTLPPIVELISSTSIGSERGDIPIDLVIAFPTTGPAITDIATHQTAPPWHYYIDRIGFITHIVDETRTTLATGNASWQGHSNLDQRALIIAIEGGATGPSDEQATALTWLLNDIAHRHNLTNEHIVQSADLGYGPSIRGWPYHIDHP